MFLSFFRFLSFSVPFLFFVFLCFVLIVASVRLFFCIIFAFLVCVQNQHFLFTESVIFHITVFNASIFSESIVDTCFLIKTVCNINDFKNTEARLFCVLKMDVSSRLCLCRAMPSFVVSCCFFLVLPFFCDILLWRQFLQSPCASVYRRVFSQTMLFLASWLFGFLWWPMMQTDTAKEGRAAADNPPIAVRTV